jgi:ribosomal protein S18 acetylase RimI-like enzyme
MSHEITVRPATVEDAPGLARLNKLFNDVDEPPAQLAARLAAPNRVETPLLAYVEGELAGFAALRVVPCVFYAEPHAEVTELYVEAAYRRRGVARALLRYAEQMAIEVGAEKLYIFTDFENHPARTLYRALGYTDEDLSLSKQLAEG